MSDTTWTNIAEALLGSWPDRVSEWGPQAITAYTVELRARGVTAAAALTAIRRCETRFPPSAGQLAALARRDPSTPTATEAYTAIYGPRGVLKARPPYPEGGWAGNELQVARDQLALARADGVSPLLGAFIRAYGLDRLRMLEVDNPDYGELRRNELRAEYEQFAHAHEHREIAAIADGRRGRMARLDPLAALRQPTVPRPQIAPATEGAER